MSSPVKKASIGAPFALLILLVTVLGSTVVKIWPEGYFWVERANARMPVWVRGNTASGTFVVLNHGGPGSCGTCESIFEVSPGNGKLGHASPMQALESDYAVVYWDQRHSGMSRGSVDANESRIEDFGNDLALVIRELQSRYEVKHIFVIGQSWGHSVAMSYLTLIDGWQENQAQVDGYIIYKGNHEQNAAYQASRPRIVQYSERETAAGRDVAYWQSALQFLQEHPALSDPLDFNVLDEYADRAMQVSVPLPLRIWVTLKASMFSPLNGWSVYFNNRKTLEAEGFLTRVTTDTTLSQTLPRLSIPVLLIYGGRDLKAPVEVGRIIYHSISTPESQKTLLILPESRHGAEGEDVLIMQNAMADFIRQSLESEE
jgi:pimeloyl-ACP methyl ester carboxylesterase